MKTKHLVKLKPLTNDFDTGGDHLEMIIQSDQDFRILKELIKQVCLITSPKLESRYKFLGEIGRGAQAIVGQYLRLPKTTCRNTQSVSYAVKRYILPYHKDTSSINKAVNKEVVFGEISYLRQLQQCQNVVQLRETYIARDCKTNQTTISLVMKFAKQGTLAKYATHKEH